MSPRRRLILLALPLVVAPLAGCGHAEVVEPAPSASDARCSEVMLGLPTDIDGQPKRTTTSQSTAAWGDPAAVVLRCGTEDPGPTNDPCTTVGGVDWVAHQNKGKDSWTLTAYGRVPGVQVTLDTSRVSSATVAGSLKDAMQTIKATKHCTSAKKG